MNFAKLLIPISFLLVLSSAEAKFYIEPILGYQSAQMEYKYTVANGGTADKGSFDGIGYGLGLGWVFGKGFYLGADAQQLNLTAKFTTLTTETKSNQFSAYVVGAYMVQPKARVYLGLGSVTTKDDAATPTTFTGQAAKIGAIYEFQNHIAASAEYVGYFYNESTTEGSAAVKVTDLYEKLQYNALIWNFRFPFEF